MFGVITRGALQKFIAHKFQSLRIEQIFIARGGSRNRIENHVSKFVYVEKFRDGRSIRPVREHSDFHACDHHVFGERIKLRAQCCGRSGMHGAHALRGLHRESCYRGYAVAIVRRESFQVGGHTRAAGRIESGDGKHDGRHRAAVIRMIVCVTTQFFTWPPRKAQMPAAPVWHDAPATEMYACCRSHSKKNFLREGTLRGI